MRFVYVLPPSPLVDLYSSDGLVSPTVSHGKDGDEVSGDRDG